MPPLSPETNRLWRRLENEPLLAGWYLIGGTHQRPAARG